MPLVIMPDGKTINMPEKLTAEQRATLIKKHYSSIPKFMKSVKFLFITDENDSIGLQAMLLSQGHKVYVYVKNKGGHDIGDGIVERVNYYEPSLSWADVIVVDSTGFGSKADEWRKQGYMVVGGTKEVEALEDDRLAGMEALEAAGIAVPAYFGPFSIDQAIKHVQDNPERYVFKPNGQQDRDLTYVAKDAEDMIHELERIKAGGLLKGTGLLQEFIDGHEMAVGTSVSGGKFVKPFQVNWEHKMLYAGDVGVNTGEQGTVAYYTDSGPLIDEFMKMEPYFKGSDYSTDFDINFIVTEDRAYALEFTCRMGWPAMYLQASVQEMDFAEYLWQLSNGSLKELPVKDPWVCGVVLSAPGYPYKEGYLKHGKGKLIPGIDEAYEPNYWILEVEKDEEGFKTSGEYGATLVVVGQGPTLEQSIESVYENIKEKEFPSWMAFRCDIGEKLMDEEIGWFKKSGWFDE